MPTYIMLSTLTPEGVQTVKNNPTRIKEVNRELENPAVARFVFERLAVSAPGPMSPMKCRSADRASGASRSADEDIPAWSLDARGG